MTTCGSPVNHERTRRVWLAPALVWLAAVTVAWAVFAWVLSYRPSTYESLSPEFPSRQLIALVTWLALTASSLGWGAWAGRLLAVLPERGWARLGVTLLLGHVAVSLLTFLIGVAHLYPWGLCVLLAGLAGLPTAVRGTGKLRMPSRCCLPFTLVAGGGLLLSFLLAFAPVVESDGIRYQLVIAQEYLKAGGIVHLPFQAFTNLPAQTNLLYLAGMSVADARVAQVIHWTYLPLVMLFSGLLARRLYRALGGKYTEIGVVAGAVAGTSPVMLVMAAWPFVDLSSAAYTLAAAWALCPGSLRSFEKRLLLAGILGGGAIGAKLTALVTVGLLGLVVLRMLATRRGKVKGLLLFVVPIIIISGPWFAKNLIYHRNPVYPAAYGLFGSNEWTDAADALYKRQSGMKGFGKSPIDLARSPIDATLRWTNFEAHNPGPMLLGLMPILLVVLIYRAARRRGSPIVWIYLLLLVPGWVAWFYTYQSVRFLLPQIGLIGGGGAAALAWLAGERRCVARGALLVLALCGFGWNAFYALASKETRPLLPALGFVDNDEYLSRNLNFYDAVQWLNVETEPGEKVLYVGEHRALYAEFELLHSDWFDEPRALVEIRKSNNNEEMLARWRKEGIRYVLWNQEELSLYEEQAFRPRFSDTEWERFAALREKMLKREYIVFSPRERVFVIDLRLVE